MFSRLAAAILTLNLAGLLFGLWCMLFGPWSEAGSILGTGCFFVSIGALAVGEWWGKRLFGPSWQGLAQEIPALRAFRRPIELLTGIYMLVMIVAVVILTCAGLGVGPVRVFPMREFYLLDAQGDQTDVSRFLSVAASTGFFVGWFYMAALPSLLLLEYVLFGRLPKWLDKRLAKNQR